VISALLPFEQAGLGGHSVSNSPFVTVFNYIGIPYADDIIRFVIITALLISSQFRFICCFTDDVVTLFTATFTAYFF
jgi:L-asparagine transporter-like permease